MRQPRQNQQIQILDNDGNIVTVTRSVALEGGPRGLAQFGPIERCPITGEVMYRSQMVQIGGTYYSPEGAEERVEALERGNARKTGYDPG